jgi:hypothetical protein
VAELGGNMKDITCKKCNWSWDKEPGDKHAYLCHKCGYDNNKEVYNFEEFNKWKEDFNKPYNEQFKDGFYYRTFSCDLDNDELVWHRDKEDRIVEVLEESDWKFQMDNELPIKLEGQIFIPKNTYHRVIKGTKDLNIRIKKITA